MIRNFLVCLTLTIFTACSKPVEQPVVEAEEPPGFVRRADIEIKEDGIAVRKGETTPYTGQIVMRDKEWKVGYFATYKEGQLHGPEIRFYQDGVTLMRWYDWMYGEKIRHREFYENGQIKIDAMMRDGEAYGKHLKWTEAGMLKFNGNFTDNLLWDGRIVDLDDEGEVLWDATFEKGRYIRGAYPKDHEQKLIDGGMLDAETLEPTADLPKKEEE